MSDNGPQNPHQRQVAQFDYLMSRYLARAASEEEKAALRRLVENGFGERFQEWLDEEYRANSGIEGIPDKTRHEILFNILGEAPVKAKRTSAWRSWAAAVLLIIGSVATFTVWNNRLTESTLTENPSETKQDEWLVFKGKQFLHLPDGSSVLMNQESELRYSTESFEKGSREVTLKGEAYFDIAHDPEKPFRVRTGPVVTRVLGTAFNVNGREKEVVVTVTRGLVEVSSEDRVYAQVKPDEQLTVNTETRQYNTAPVKAEAALTWKQAYLVFDNIDMQEAGRLIGNHYGVELLFTDAAIKKCRITASFLDKEDLSTVLKVLSEMMEASYTIEGSRVLITGGSCS